MTREELDQRYSNIVANYLNDGWKIRTNRMDYTNGTISHIEVYKDGKFARICMDKFTENGRYYSGGIVLYVEITDIPWNNFYNDSEKVFEAKYYTVSGSYDREWYGTKEEQDAAEAIRSKRRENRTAKWFDLGDQAKKIVLPFIRRQYKCKSVRWSDITQVVKETEYSGHPCYRVWCKNNCYILR